MAPKSYDPPLDLQRSTKVIFVIVIRTFGDLCRSNGWSYDFGAMETFNQHAKIYRYAEFHKNRTGRTFPIGKVPCPFTTSIRKSCDEVNVSFKKLPHSLARHPVLLRCHFTARGNSLIVLTRTAA